LTLPLRPNPTLDFTENILHLLFSLSCNISPALIPGFQVASPLNSHSTLSSQPSLGFGTTLSQVKTPRVEPCFFYVNTPISISSIVARRHQHYPYSPLLAAFTVFPLFAARSERTAQAQTKVILVLPHPASQSRQTASATTRTPPRNSTSSSRKKGCPSVSAWLVILANRYVLPFNARNTDRHLI
jgi:hypothetical protein